MMGRHYYPSLSRAPAPSPDPGNEERIFPGHAAPSPPVTAWGTSLSSPSGGPGQLELGNELDSLPKSRRAQDGKRGKKKLYLKKPKPLYRLFSPLLLPSLLEFTDMLPALYCWRLSPSLMHGALELEICETEPRGDKKLAQGHSKSEWLKQQPNGSFFTVCSTQ